MPRDWQRYLSNSRTDAGRAIVVQGNRLHEARQRLTESQYLDVLSNIGVTPREARLLGAVGRRLHVLVELDSSIRLPYRIRTLSTLSDLSADALKQAAEDGLLQPSMTESEARALRGTTPKVKTPVIRSTDNWNFATLRWPRIDGWEGHGYIPGDLYANCLWYYAHKGDTVLDPMAGSGMMLKVWEDRADWCEDENWHIKPALSDLVPRGPYADQIIPCDLLNGKPAAGADYIIIDPPYSGLVKGQYSELPNDLANMDPEDWTNAMGTIAERLWDAQPEHGRCTIIVPNNRDIPTGERTLFPEIVRRLFQEAGYRLYDVAYASRRTQQKQSRSMAILNNRARQKKVPMAGISEVLTFIKA